RDFLNSKDFMEVDTPVLENTTGGADARPFETHHNAFDMDVFLRISAGELWQKRLMVAGFEKIFELGRIFRNEGISPEHAQDYNQVEVYWAYADYKDMMKLVKEMYLSIIDKVYSKRQFKIRNFDLDFNKEWYEIDYTEIIKEKTGIDIFKSSDQEIIDKLVELNIKVEDNNRTRMIDYLWKYIRKGIAGPAFLVNEPKFTSPLAKSDFKNPEITHRFHVIIAGSEVGNGYSELNDPIDQEERFTSQQKLRDSGDEEAQMADIDFVEALKYGMPPTAGFGISERLFSFLEDKPIRECQTFPLMKNV
ncbi:lysine--tRNA ligase, partial [Candidatus Gracilibacteria bacterium]|nr:lysine--tRNA ligase [Candidatus Gracilibacteria bacterium]